MTEQTVARARAGVSRRRIVQGAAWAAPAVMIATAAPALAVSAGSSVSGFAWRLERNGNSDNFVLEVSAAVSGIAAGEVIIITGAFDAGVATVTVTDNSSGWGVITTPGTGSGFTFVAQRTHDGSASLAVAKFKILATPGSAVLSKPVTLTFTSGGFTLGNVVAAFPAA